jgi:hypothetical protein
MSTTTYYAIRSKIGRDFRSPPGVSSAPHLYRTAGIAEARRKQGYSADKHEVVPVELTIPGATHVERLHQEYDQLQDRLTKLRAFLKTDAYVNLPDVDHLDLVEQEALMTRLAAVLFRRLDRAHQQKAAA